MDHWAYDIVFFIGTLIIEVPADTDTSRHLELVFFDLGFNSSRLQDACLVKYHAARRSIQLFVPVSTCHFIDLVGTTFHPASLNQRRPRGEGGGGALFQQSQILIVADLFQILGILVMLASAGYDFHPHFQLWQGWRSLTLGSSVIGFLSCLNYSFSNSKIMGKY